MESFVTGLYPLPPLTGVLLDSTHSTVSPFMRTGVGLGVGVGVSVGTSGCAAGIVTCGASATPRVTPVSSAATLISDSFLISCATSIC